MDSISSSRRWCSSATAQGSEATATLAHSWALLIPPPLLTVATAQGEVLELRAEVERRAEAAFAASASTAAADTAALQDELSAAQAHLREQEAELQRLRAAADDSGQLLAQREALLRGELGALQAQLQVSASGQ